MSKAIVTAKEALNYVDTKEDLASKLGACLQYIKGLHPGTLTLVKVDLSKKWEGEKDGE